jgi:hypothetical protein
VGLDLKPLVRAVVDMGSGDLEARIRNVILFAGVVGLILILAWKRG